MINKLPEAKPNKQSKLWRVIKKMYDNVTSSIRVTTDDEEVDSEDYEVNHDLREGPALSRLLYSIFINDVISKNLKRQTWRAP